jgi:mono/diheme cytochrome c family protein
MSRAAPLLGAGLLLAAASTMALAVTPTPPSPSPDGRALFLGKCGYCHLPMGPGTVTLQRRLSAEQALLANRADLQAAYVKVVVRHGLNSMPAINRAEVSDPELDAIARWLEKGPKARATP